ncbi:MAG: protein kinase [Acidobacteria bacterium]|nr:protein kinase [Acidobacteriota bacterium]
MGAGGLGVVYRGTDTTLRRPVALKFLVGASDDERGRTRFLREARMAASLNHPTICKVHRVGEVEQALSIGSGESIARGTPYIVMEWVEGETLAERIARSPLPLSELADVAVQIAEGLEEAHASGVVHRDLKPKNVMTTAQGRIKILDFGLARQTSPATSAYSSPEQLMGHSLDARSDQFSFGILLYEMATGRHPVAGESATPALPARLERIVERCLNKRPEDRYTSTSELRGELEAFRHAIAPAVTTRKRRWVRTWWGVTAIGLLAVAAGWWILGRGTGPVLSPEARLVVLPFENLSEDPFETDYLAFGVSQSLNNRLSAAGLNVSPWDRVAGYVGSGASSLEIGRELNVDAVFEGTFEIAGDDVSVQLSLVDTESGATLWESSLTGSYEDLFELQRRMGVVCASLAGDLSVEQISKLSGDESSSLDALDSYMQGSYLFVQGDLQSIEPAYQRFRRAVEIDPQLAEAYIGLGAVHYARYNYGLGGGQEELVLAEEAYSKAIGLSSQLLRARRGLIKIYWRRGQTERVLDQGEEAAIFGREDDVETLLARGEAYMFGELADASVPLFERVLELDPRNREARFFLVIAHGWSDGCDGAITVGEDYFRRYGFEPEIHKHVALCYEFRNEPEQARRHHDLAIRGFNPRSTTIEVFLRAGQFYRSSGDEATAVRVLREGVEQGLARLTEDPENAGTQAWLGVLYAALGDVSSFEGHAATAIRLDPDNGFLNGLIAEGHCMLGRNERAAEGLAETLRLGAFYPWLGPPLLRLSCGGLEGFGPYLDAYAEEERRLRSRYGPDLRGGRNL